MIKIYNTLTRKKDIFKSIEGKEARIFTCGPTVYDYAHIGNFRSYMASDLLIRWLEHRGFRVNHIMNITDIDDKIINRAKESSKNPLDLARQFELIFYKDLEKLRIKRIDLFARATDHIPEIIDQIRRLIEKGIAYETKSGIYFNVTKFPDYGKLSQQNLEQLTEHRIEPDPTKQNSADFSLWKFQKNKDEISWNSPWGEGRPGWHIEDTAITEKYHGPQYDIHGGGVDLIFPHHEAEIAQMEAVSGRSPLVKYWFHCEHLFVENQKMSKSLGNIITLHDIITEGYKPLALRYFLLSAQRRTQLNFTWEALRKAQETLEKLNDFYGKIEFLINKVEKGKANAALQNFIDKATEEFEKSMDDDLNTPQALAVLHELIAKVNHAVDERKIDKKSLIKTLDFLLLFNDIFDVLDTTEYKIKQEELEMIQEREKLREQRKYKEADHIRNLLRQRNIILEDTPYGVRWKKIK